MSQSRTRLPHTSIAGSANSVARITSATVCRSWSRSARSTSATSASARACHDGAGGDLGAVGYRHVGVEHAEVGDVHAELALHGGRCEADRAADEAAAGRERRAVSFS